MNIAGLDSAALNTLQDTLVSIKSQFPTADQVMVVPDDDVVYDDIVHVLERVKLAKFPKISLTSTARSMQVASTSPGGR